MNKFAQTSIAAVVCGLVLVGCGNDAPADKAASSVSTAASQPQVAATVPGGSNAFAKQLPDDAPVINVATEAGFPPFEFYDKQGSIIGLDADIIHAIAADQNMKAVIRHQAWEKVFSGVTGDNNKDQVVIAALGAQGREDMAIEKSNYYLLSPNVVLVNENSPIKSIEDLEGKHISVLTDSVSLKQLNAAGIKPAQVSETKASYLSFKALANGQVDAIIDDNTVMSYHLTNYPELKFRKVAFPNKLEEQALVIIVGKGNTELLNKLNTGLANIRSNGTYDKILAKWGLDPNVVAPRGN